jgi:hypothetical protein
LYQESAFDDYSGDFEFLEDLIRLVSIRRAGRRQFKRTIAVLAELFPPLLYSGQVGTAQAP